MTVSPTGRPSIPPSDRISPTLWRHADFMKLWVGQTVSWFGSALSRLAIPLIAALTLAATPAQMGLLAAVGTAPALLIGIFTGVWVDRFRRRNILIVSDIGRAILLLTIPLAVFLGVLSMAQMYVVGFLSGSITAVGGPSLACVIIQAVTAPIAIILDAVSYLASALCVLLIRRREYAPHASYVPMLIQVREGLGLVLRNPLLRAFAGCLATSNFASNIFFALYILFGTRELGMDAAELGLTYGLGASGAV